MRGYGVAQDNAEALRWCKLAATRGHGETLHFVGFGYEKGHGVAADWVEATRWYKHPAAAGHSSAAYQLKRLGA